MKKVLIVDDEVLIRYSLIKVIQGMGLETRDVTTGEDAVREISLYHYDLCFLDMNLPGINGLGVMQVIHERSPATKVIVITGYYIDELVGEELKTADYFITKPFDIHQVRRLVKEALFGDETMSAIKERPTPQTRHLSRAPASETVFFRAPFLNENGVQWISMEGVIVDRSERGIGIITKQPFEVGRILKIGNLDSLRTGVVRWSAHSPQKDEFRIGIEFI